MCAEELCPRPHRKATHALPPTSQHAIMRRVGPNLTLCSCSHAGKRTSTLDPQRSLLPHSPLEGIHYLRNGPTTQAPQERLPPDSPLTP